MKHPVWQELFLDIIGSNPSIFKGAKLPVENLTFLEAINFCNVLSNKLNFEEVYLINSDGTIGINNLARGCRLPFEAEWDFAFSLIEVNIKDDLAQHGWFSENSNYETHPITDAKTNEIGIFDLTGNVWEWCFDNYQSPPNYETFEDFYCILSSKTRVVKGGSYSDIRSAVIRSCFRKKLFEKRREKNCGFRVVIQNIDKAI
jgi:formylglycine-generating enzyme required for sulfatase activity